MATVDVGANSYPSFADLDYADEYLGGDVMRATAWALKGPDARGRGLVSATRMLQGLRWVGTLPTTDEPPAIVRDVTVMLAADLLAKPKLFADASGNSNVKSAKAGSASVEFFAQTKDGPPLPMALWGLLLGFGLVRPIAAVCDLGAGAEVSGISGGCRPWKGRYGDDLSEGEDGYLGTEC